MINEKTPSLEEFFEKTFFHVEDKIDKTISDDNIKSILQGGKRLRSLLAQLSFKVCTRGKEKYEHYQKSLEGSVSIELAHGASLVHDDIIDKDKSRRGRPALHIKQGISKALLTGHQMLAHGFKIALSHGKEIAQLYVDSWNEVVIGEIDEVEFNKFNIKYKAISSREQIIEAYNKIIDLKTAVLFSSACKAGVLEANMNGEILKVFSDYGREIGLAYQLADDLVDLCHGEIINSVILPLIKRFENKPRFSFIKSHEIKKLFRKNERKIRTYYINEIKKHIENAENLSKSELIPESKYKSLMNQAPNYIINKMLDDISIKV
jgi:geranylgeranyl pyrophosphate synthase